MKKSFRKMMSQQSFAMNRLEAFSDGVFAIVITLLVLELRVPEVHDPAELVPGLKALLPKFVSFVVSFLYVTIYWINHHQLFHLIKRSNRGLFWLNSLFLMCLTFIPFPTALIGSYPQETAAVVFYGLAMLATAISFVLMKVYIVYETSLGEVKQPGPPVFYLAAGPFLYLAAVLLALVNTAFAIVIYLMIPVIYFFAGGIEE